MKMFLLVLTLRIVFGWRLTFLDRPKEFGRDYRFALVRPSVRPDIFRSNGSTVFSDFWYQGSFLWYLEDYEAGFLRTKFFWPKMAKKV